METEKNEVNYEKEYENLNSGAAVFKPKMGVHKVEVLAEPTKTLYVDQQTKEETPQLCLEVSVEGEKKKWYVGIGSTTKSVYGQLVALGKSKGNLAGELLTLQVTSAQNKDGKTVNSYTILEAVTVLADLAKDEVPVEEVK